jgi:hypothetical protein
MINDKRLIADCERREKKKNLTQRRKDAKGREKEEKIHHRDTEGTKVDIFYRRLRRLD